MSPEAQAQGLKVHRLGWIYFGEESKALINKDAGAAYLDIKRLTAETLFFPTRYVSKYTRKVTTQNIIDRIEYLLQVGEDTYLKAVYADHNPMHVPGLSLPGGCYPAKDQS